MELERIEDVKLPHGMERLKHNIPDTWYAKESRTLEHPFDENKERVVFTNPHGDTTIRLSATEMERTKTKTYWRVSMSIAGHGHTNQFPSSIKLDRSQLTPYLIGVMNRWEDGFQKIGRYL